MRCTAQSKMIRTGSKLQLGFEKYPGSPRSGLSREVWAGRVWAGAADVDCGGHYIL